MIWYITYNEPPNGLYASQVVEVLHHVKRELNKDVRLVAFLPLFGFYKWRRRLKSMEREALAVPCLPGFRGYRFHHLWLLPLLWRSRPDKIVCRGSFAANVGFGLRSLGGMPVVLDARGLIHEENKEYAIFPSRISRHIREVEINSLKRADAVSAITREMFDYWEREYNLRLEVPRYVIPCTVSQALLETPDSASVEGCRKRLGFMPSDIVFVYSGSVAPWQSLERVSQWVAAVLEVHADTKALFLCQSTPEIETLIKTYPHRVVNTYVPHREVPRYLACADYGLLLRGKSVTNSVCSPTKMAEYLLAGLAIVTNRNMAIDALVEREGLGIVVDNFSIPPSFAKISNEQRGYYQRKGAEHFSKSSPSIRKQYEELYG